VPSRRRSPAATGSRCGGRRSVWAAMRPGPRRISPVGVAGRRSMGRCRLHGWFWWWSWPAPSGRCDRRVRSWADVVRTTAVGVIEAHSPGSGPRAVGARVRSQGELSERRISVGRRLVRFKVRYVRDCVRLNRRIPGALARNRLCDERI
jgi:hypothetical protein